MAQSAKLQQFLKTFGPGIMFAGTCIGGSHLVQSTRAGAIYGFDLLFIVLLANFFKYPFFEFASRYTNATGNSVLEGYKQIGKWSLALYGAITLLTMFIVTAAILLVAGGLLGNLFEADPKNIFYWVLGIAIIVWLLLMSGKFSLLDDAMKIIGAVLVLSVVGSTITVLINGPIEKVAGFENADFYTIGGFTFIIGLMGWMPMGVDMSAWTSLWTQERIKQTGYYPTMKETLLDFKIGYFITVFLAICFLTLGAYVMHGSGQELSTNGISFSKQLVTMFTSSIGSWSYIIIAAAAFSTMFGTSLTLVDGYARSMDRVVDLWKGEKNTNYLKWVTATMIGGLLVVVFCTVLKNIEGKPLLNFKGLIDLATGISFLVAPIAGWLNYKIIFNENFPDEHKPPMYLKILAISGLIFLSAFTLAYLYVKIFE